MAEVKDKTSSNPPPNNRPAIDSEARQNQLIALAVDCAEQQFRHAIASSQENV